MTTPDRPYVIVCVACGASPVGYGAARGTCGSCGGRKWKTAPSPALAGAADAYSRLEDLAPERSAPVRNACDTPPPRGAQEGRHSSPAAPKGGGSSVDHSVAAPVTPAAGERSAPAATTPAAAGTTGKERELFIALTRAVDIFANVPAGDENEKAIWNREIVPALDGAREFLLATQNAPPSAAGTTAREVSGMPALSRDEMRANGERLPLPLRTALSAWLGAYARHAQAGYPFGRTGLESIAAEARAIQAILDFAAPPPVPSEGAVPVADLLRLAEEWERWANALPSTRIDATYQRCAADLRALASRGGR